MPASRPLEPSRPQRIDPPTHEIGDTKLHIILGGTGHVGSAVADTLLKRGETVTVVTRSADHAAGLAERGALVAEADIADTEGLRQVLRGGKRLFLLNPPADPSGNTDRIEARTIGQLLAAIEGSGLDYIVAQSTYGAQEGSAIGDLGTLWQLEQGLAAQPIPHAINRAAYYMTNWDMALDSAREQGVLTSFFPADFEIAMVAPQDMGEAAAKLLTDADKPGGVHFVEGPRRYTPGDVAAAFAKALNRPVRVETVPRDKLEETFASMGFSPEAARSYAGMTELTLDNPQPLPPQVYKGRVTLEDYIARLVAGRKAG